MDPKTGASLTGFTVKVKVFVSVREPSVTTTVTLVEPCSLSAGDKERLQFGAVPDFVILEFGRRVVLEEVTVMELVQSGAESTSLNE
jgi:hypothetical protein